MSKLLINDLFEELIDENNRLLNDLRLSQRCLKLMQNYRKCLISFNDNCICDQSLDQKKSFIGLENEYKTLCEDIQSNDTSIEDNISRSVTKMSEFGINSCKKRKTNDLSDNQKNKKRLKSSAIDSSDGEEEDNEPEVKPNVKFLSKNDFLLEENGSVITRREDKNGLILVVKQNDKSDQIFGYRCNWSDCQYVSVSKLKIKDHLRSVHNRNGLFVCRKCDQKFMSQKEVTNHTTEEHSKHYQCPHTDCNYTSRTRQHLNDHLKRHEGVKPYLCSETGCDKRFTTRQELRRHTNCVHLDLKFVCDWPGCEQVFRSNRSLDTHKTSHY